MTIILDADVGVLAPRLDVDANTGVFKVSANTLGVSTDGVERFRVTDAGAIVLPGGSPGIKFGTRNANLADYEEGTWTPTPSSSATPPTVAAYIDRVGTYTKVGNTVNVRCNLRLNITSAGTGNAHVTGLPFIAAGTFSGPAFGLRGQLSGGVPATADTFLNGSTLILSGCSWRVANGDYLTFQITYQVA